jgi:hypothetical protein
MHPSRCILAPGGLAPLLQIRVHQPPPRVRHACCESDELGFMRKENSQNFAEYVYM